MVKKAADLVVLALITLLASLPASAGETCTFSYEGAGLNIRAHPSLSAEILDVAGSIEDIDVSAYFPGDEYIWILWSGQNAETSEFIFGWVAIVDGVEYDNCLWLTPEITNPELQELESGWPAYPAYRINPITMEIENGEVWIQELGPNHASIPSDIWGEVIIGFFRH